VEYAVKQSDTIDPGSCPHCGGEQKWKATVGVETTAQIHFYQCEGCDHIHTVEQELDYVANRTLE